MSKLTKEGLGLVSSAARRIREVVEYLPDNPIHFLGDRGIQDQVTLRLILAIQDCISVAADALAKRGAHRTGGLSTLFEQLVGTGDISEELAVALQAAAKFRNQLLFDFDSVNVNQIYDAAREFPEHLVDYLGHMASDEDVT